jgi:hypothetical protein
MVWNAGVAVFCVRCLGTHGISQSAQGTEGNLGNKTAWFEVQSPQLGRSLGQHIVERLGRAIDGRALRNAPECSLDLEELDLTCASPTCASRKLLGDDVWYHPKQLSANGSDVLLRRRLNISRDLLVQTFHILHECKRIVKVVHRTVALSRCGQLDRNCENNNNTESGLSCV